MTFPRWACLLAGLLVSATLVAPAHADTELRLLQVGANARSYFQHVPASYDGTRAVPLVLMLHGGFGNGLQFEAASGFSDKSDQVGFIVVYPNALGTPRAWNTGWSPTPGAVTPADEIAFFTALLDRLQANFRIDANRVYIGGHSSGACMTHLVGAALSPRIAAIGAVAGTVGGSYRGKYGEAPLPTAPVSALLIHGLEDTSVPYFGGLSASFPWEVQSVAYSTFFWLLANNCGLEPQIDVAPDWSYLAITFPGGTNGTEVKWYTIVAGGHPWPQPPLFAASDVLWEFFASHPRR